MHLHGFYFRVDARGNGYQDSLYALAQRRMGVTEDLSPDNTMYMVWSPNREGNWLFHCHLAFHVVPGAAQLHRAADPHASHSGNAQQHMSGLILGINVRRGNDVATVARMNARQLHLYIDEGRRRGVAPRALGYVLQSDNRIPAVDSVELPGSVIVLTKNEPTDITVVNRLDEPTSVHWHGIELDSYYDGVAGFGGHPGHISPEIAPNDSFVARFTPPRSGTFMYHPHVNEFRQQQAGLDGALLVVDAPAVRDSTTDIAWLVTTPRLQSEDGTVYVNGSATPPAQNLRAGVRYRIRLMNLHNSRPALNVKITRASMPLTWRALAKDGMDLPPSRATVRPSVQLLANGETYDFEFTAPEAGELRLEIAANRGDLLFSMPIKVR
jgi:FtsP/CotA-like multicopper oxidase with cupredoxin domain